MTLRSHEEVTQEYTSNQQIWNKPEKLSENRRIIQYLSRSPPLFAPPFYEASNRKRSKVENSVGRALFVGPPRLVDSRDPVSLCFFAVKRTAAMRYMAARRIEKCCRRISIGCQARPRIARGRLLTRLRFLGECLQTRSWDSLCFQRQQTSSRHVAVDLTISTVGPTMIGTSNHEHRWHIYTVFCSSLFP